jgi:1-acyl-sn-glycerol-3-phosphate acyltransferase
VAEPTRRAGGDRLQHAWYAVARIILTGSCRLVWGVRITGRERLPATGAYIIAPNHRSFIDTFLCGFVTPRPLRYMAKSGLWRWRWSARLVESLGGIPVHRGLPDREAIRICEEALRGGQPVVLFPEGTRRDGPTLHPLLDGPAFIAARTGVPIVPVGVGGSEWALPRGAKMIKRVQIDMVVGEPLSAPQPAPGSTRVSRRAVREATDTLAKELQQLYDEALDRAGRTGQLAPGAERRA